MKGIQHITQQYTQKLFKILSELRSMNMEGYYKTSKKADDFFKKVSQDMRYQAYWAVAGGIAGALKIGQGKIPGAAHYFEGSSMITGKVEDFSRTWLNGRIEGNRNDGSFQREAASHQKEIAAQFERECQTLEQGISSLQEKEDRAFHLR